MDELRPDRAEMERTLDGRSTPWEKRVVELAGELAYPPTPDLTRLPLVRRAAARRRTPTVRAAWAVALLVVALALALLAVPQVRAAVVRVFQLGGVRIFVSEPATPTLESQTAEPAPGVRPPLTAEPAPVTATPGVPQAPTALPVVTGAAAAQPTGDAGLPPSLAGLAGQTTLSEAQRQARFPIVLPAYPAGLGPPDYVFFQKHAGPVVILAWNDEAVKGGVKLSLWMFLSGMAIDKIEPETVQETSVNGRRALWTTGTHMLFLRSGDVDVRRLVLGNTLVWDRENMTYRLETSLPLEEAVKVAESVR